MNKLQTIPKLPMVILIAMLISIITFRGWLPVDESITTIYGYIVILIFFPIIIVCYIVLALIKMIKRELVLGLYALLLLVLCVTFLYIIPDKKLVQTRSFFYENRSALIKQAKTHMQDHIEFTPIDFYWPIVFTKNDRPEEIHDTCSAGGHVISRLEENWYICRRDWN